MKSDLRPVTLFLPVACLLKRDALSYEPGNIYHQEKYFQQKKT